ncbi:PID-CTERM protein-sorting domain-containing protein [Phaeocystidibacter luteus]|uniref:PID-CTERM protein-sorting domain-containing protein n=1 Tax=Phaeocystidibacter luteus TaxID=911197 RepID=UPI001479027C|nr:hypothetical protein [Phaeocystidibacter luteus]
MSFRNTLVIVFFLAGFAVMAQPGNPSTPAPIDGGISLLIAAGASLGAKKIYDKRKNLQ